MQQEFIETNIKRELIKEGFDEYIASNAARHAGRFYARAMDIPKGKVFDECMKKARAQAKLMRKAK